jgi:hypothetical protein
MKLTRRLPIASPLLAGCLSAGLVSGGVAQVAPGELASAALPFPARLVQAVPSAQIASYRVSIEQFESAWSVQRIIQALRTYWQARPDALLIEPASSPWQVISIKTANMTINYQLQSSGSGAMGLISRWAQLPSLPCKTLGSQDGLIASRCMVHLEGAQRVTTEHLSTHESLSQVWNRLERLLRKIALQPLPGSFKTEGDVRHGMWTAAGREWSVTGVSTANGAALIVLSRENHPSGVNTTGGER